MSRVGLTSTMSSEVIFARVEVARADNHRAVGIDLWPKSSQIDQLLIADADQRRQRHTMNVATRRCLIRIEVGVRIDPDHPYRPARTHHAGDRSHRQAM